MPLTVSGVSLIRLSWICMMVGFEKFRLAARRRESVATQTSQWQERWTGTGCTKPRGLGDCVWWVRRDGETMETVRDFIFGVSKITADGDCSHEIKRHLLLGRKAMTNLDSILKSRDIILPTKVHLVKAIVFPVVMYGMWELDYKGSWVPKNWCFWTVVLKKTLESPLDCKAIQPVHLKGNQSWIFIGRTDAEAEAPILRPPDGKN